MAEQINQLNEVIGDIRNAFDYSHL